MLNCIYAIVVVLFAIAVIVIPDCCRAEDIPLMWGIATGIALGACLVAHEDYKLWRQRKG